ncbi:MAG: cytochrome c protein [Azospirillum sp.]|nr:cytochrome c protein [Azospirillum sp.]
MPTRSAARAAACVVAVLALTASGLVLADQPKAPNDPTQPIDPWDNPYAMVDGKIDFGTYNGFRRYHASCHVCHGPAGLGSSFAPNLLDPIRERLDYQAFQETVINGRQVEGATGDRVMPPFGLDPNVVEYVPDIWGYLKARADGVLDRGRPDHLAKGALKGRE